MKFRSVGNFSTKTKAEHFASFLAKKINEGEVKGLLPSVRFLSNSHAVSVVTVSKAIEILAEQGLVRRRGKRRRFGVLSDVEKSKSRLLILCFTPLRRLHTSLVTSLRLLKDFCTLNGIGMTEEFIADYSVQEAMRRCHDLTAQGGYGRVILIHPTRQICDALAGSGLGLAILTDKPMGMPGATVFEVPVVSVVSHLVERAVRLGHGEIALLGFSLLPTERARLVELAGSLGARLRFLEDAFSGSDWREDDGAAEGIVEQMRGAPSTCLLLPRWMDFNAIAGRVRETGLALPGRISVALAYLESSFVTYKGLSISGHEIPEDLAYRMFVKWLSTGACDPESFGADVIKTWRAGDTLRAI